MGYEIYPTFWWGYEKFQGFKKSIPTAVNYSLCPLPKMVILLSLHFFLNNVIFSFALAMGMVSD